MTEKSEQREATGLGALGETPSGSGAAHPLIKAMGGTLGILETLVPGLVFFIAYSVTGFPPGMPWLALACSVVASLGFLAYRIIRRQTPTQAIAGLLSVGASALIAVWSNRPENNFLIGIWTNAGYGIAFLISVFVGWPLVGVFVGIARQEGVKWRANRHQRRVYTGITMLWVGMFAIRVIVEVPLFLAGNVSGLAMTKLVLGLPLYVPVLTVSWLIIRGLYREKAVSQVS